MNTEIIVWDVQHGNAVTIKTPEGKLIWCDAGTGSYDNGEQFSPYRYMKFPRIDYLILSHPHDDHIADFFNMPEKNVEHCIYDSLKSEEYIKLIAPKRVVGRDMKSIVIKHFILQPPSSCGQIFQENLVGLYCYWVDEDIGDNLNNYSVVAFFIHGKNIVCFPGDIEEKGWDLLCRRYGYFKQLLRNTNILFASHHGRRQGWYSQFSSLCKPDIVIISDSNEKETSITSFYEKITKGVEVENFSEKQVTKYLADVKRKKCLSTRDNGVIAILINDNDLKICCKRGI